MNEILDSAMEYEQLEDGVGVLENFRAMVVSV